MAVKDFFDTFLPGKIAQDPGSASGVNAVFLFTITGDEGGQWTVNLKDDVGVKPGDSGSSECQIECTSADWAQIQANPQSAMQLYFEGKLKVGGNVMLATNLQSILA